MQSAPGSPLWCHPLAVRPTCTWGPPLTCVAVIPAHERHLLLTAAKMFNQKPDRQANDFSDTARKLGGAGIKPGDDFNQRATWAEVLEPLGWVLVAETGGVGYWKRPGGASQWSATTNFAGNDLFYVFSTNAGLESGEVVQQIRGIHPFEPRWRLHGGGEGALVEGVRFAGVARHCRREGTGGLRAQVGGSTQAQTPGRDPVDSVSCRCLARSGAAIRDCRREGNRLRPRVPGTPDLGRRRLGHRQQPRGIRQAILNWARAADLRGCPVIADSGSQKSPALRTVLKSIMEAQNIALHDYEEKMKVYEVAKHNFDAEMKDRERKKRKTEDPPPDPPELPICRRFWVSDVTIEGLAPILKENPRGALMYREELSGWFGSFDQYKSKGKGGDVGHWLSVYGGDPMLFDRKTNRATIHVPKAAVCVVGSIQPRIIARCLGSEHFENGMAARLMPAFPPKRPRVWTDADVDPADEQALAQMFASLYDNPVIVDGNGTPKPIAIHMTPAARKLWTEYYNTHGKLQADLTGDLAAAASKLEGGAVRLALVVQLMRDPHSELIDAESMAAGIALARWFQNEVQRVYAVLAETPDQAEARKVADWIAHRGCATARELMQANRRFRNSAEHAEEFLNAMVDAGILVSAVTTPGEVGGRPTTEYRLSPVYETPSYPEEDEGFVDTADVEGAEMVDDDMEEGGFDDLD